MTELEQEVKKIKIFLVFLYITKLTVYGIVATLVGASTNLLGGILTFLLLYLGAGHIERQIYGYKRALSMVKMIDGIKKQLDKVDKNEQD